MAVGEAQEAVAPRYAVAQTQALAAVTGVGLDQVAAATQGEQIIEPSRVVQLHVPRELSAPQNGRAAVVQRQTTTHAVTPSHHRAFNQHNTAAWFIAGFNPRRDVLRGQPLHLLHALLQRVNVQHVARCDGKRILVGPPGGIFFSALNHAYLADTTDAEMQRQDTTLKVLSRYRDFARGVALGDEFVIQARKQYLNALLAQALPNVSIQLVTKPPDIPRDLIIEIKTTDGKTWRLNRNRQIANDSVWLKKRLSRLQQLILLPNQFIQSTQTLLSTRLCHGLSRGSGDPPCRDGCPEAHSTQIPSAFSNHTPPTFTLVKSLHSRIQIPRKSRAEAGRI